MLVFLLFMAADKNRLELTANGILEPLVKLLSSPVLALRQQASLCLATLMSVFDARQTLRKTGVPFIEPLVQLLSADQSAIANENAWYAVPAR